MKSMTYYYYLMTYFDVSWSMLWLSTGILKIISFPPIPYPSRDRLNTAAPHCQTLRVGRERYFFKREGHLLCSGQTQD